MNIDEAIQHCEEVAKSKCDECGLEHKQLAAWLRELSDCFLIWIGEVEV